jgi:hypothetical protein
MAFWIAWNSRHRGHDGLPDGLQPGMLVTANELHGAHAAILEALKELPPVCLGLTKLNAAAKGALLPLAARGRSRFSCP